MTATFRLIERASGEMSVKDRAKAVGQEHVFEYLKELEEEDQTRLTADVGDLPLDDLANMFKGIGFEHTLESIHSSTLVLSQFSLLFDG